MLRNSRRLTLALLLAVALVLLGTGRAPADPPCVAPPVVYAPAPTVAYYAPTVSYYAPPPVVSYYAPPAVSYYAPAPVVSYYAPTVAYAVPRVAYVAAPGAVTTTTYYGLFGRPRRTVTSYYP